MHYNNQNVTLFEPAPCQLALEKEQTSQLTTIHLDESLEIVQLSFINVKALLNNQQLITIDLQRDLKILTLLQCKDSQFPDVLQGQVLALECVNEQEQRGTEKPGSVELRIDRETSSIDGIVKVSDQHFLIKPLGGSLHAICKLKTCTV